MITLCAGYFLRKPNIRSHSAENVKAKWETLQDFLKLILLQKIKK